MLLKKSLLNKRSMITMVGKQLNIKVTEFCNANCSFCGYRKQDFQKKIKSGYKPSVLDVDLFIKNLDLLK